MGLGRLGALVGAVRFLRRQVRIALGVVAAVGIVVAALAVGGSNDDQAPPMGPPHVDLDDPTPLGLLLNDIDASRPATWVATVDVEGRGEDTHFAVAYTEVETADPALRATAEVRWVGRGELDLPSAANYKDLEVACGGCTARLWMTEAGQSGFVLRVGAVEAVLSTRGEQLPELERWVSEAARAAVER